MFKKTVTLTCVILLLLTMISLPVQAESGPEVLHSSVKKSFPMLLTFNLEAASSAEIVDIRLSYQLDRTGFAEVTSETFVEFSPDTEVEVAWTLELLRIGGLPAGTGISFWWTIEDANGRVTSTAPAAITFDDNRYDWQSLTEGRVTLHWYDGDNQFAEELMEAAQEALERLAEGTGAQLEKPADIYIYANASALQGAMIFPAEWTGGVAFTRFGIIAIGISYENLAWGRNAVAHELSHLVIHQITLNPYNSLPVWLDEGLAMHGEETISPQYTSQLYEAIQTDSLLSVRSLSSPFSAYSELAYLSYAESYSIVEYLISEYGQPKMLELLNTFREGSTTDDALRQVYGFDTEGLDDLWQVWIKELYQSAANPAAAEPVLVAAGR
jgi:hypothetical protein